MKQTILRIELNKERAVMLNLILHNTLDSALYVQDDMNDFIDFLLRETDEFIAKYETPNRDPIEWAEEKSYGEVFEEPDNDE